MILILILQCFFAQLLRKIDSAGHMDVNGDLQECHPQLFHFPPQNQVLQIGNLWKTTSSRCHIQETYSRI